MSKIRHEINETGGRGCLNILFSPEIIAHGGTLRNDILSGNVIK